MFPTAYAILYIIPAFLSAALAVYGLRRRHRAGAIPFSLLMIALAFWSACHSASVASTAFETTLYWSQVQYGGVVAIGPLWLLFALAYANRESLATTSVRILMVALAILSYLAVLTNGIHHLWWIRVGLSEDHPFGALQVVRGPLFWTHTALTYTYLMVGIVLFIRQAVGASHFYKQQAYLIIIGALIPLVGNIASLAGLRVTFVDDPTPFLLLASAVLLFYASSRYLLLDLTPIAQRQIFEHMPDGVVVLDQRGVIISVNPSAQQFFPTQAKIVVGKQFSTQLACAPYADDVQAMVGGEVLQSRRVSYTIDGMLHGVEVRTQPLRERSGARAGVLLVFRDMSEQVRAEETRDQRLREMALLQQITSAANSAVGTEDVLRVISNETLQTLPWQRIVIGLLQPDRSTLRLIADYPSGNSTLEGRTIDAHSYGILLDLVRAKRPRVLHLSDTLIAGTTTEAAMIELGIQTLVCLPLVSQEKSLGMLFVGSQHDRSVAAEEMRLFEMVSKLTSDTIVRTQLYESAQEANTLKSAFLATVSHELRTPLTSMIGFADMLKAGLLGELSEDADSAVFHIQRSSHILLRLINDVLDFSKMEAGRFAIDVYPVDLGLVVKVVANTMLAQLYERGLSLTVNIPANLPFVQGNSSRLEQILLNLVGNAVKFTETGGITISAQQVGQKVRICVRDTGIGIPSEHHTSVFDAFRQVENPLTRRYGGTGLGLAISKRLTELMGGTIALESTPGIGSIFCCEFHTMLDMPQVESQHTTQFTSVEVNRLR